MSRVRIPDEVLDAAHARSKARAAGDWAEADRLRGVIEAAGWKVVDRGTDFALTLAAPPDLAEGEAVRYGASQNVPSRLGEPPVGLATVVLVATDQPGDVARTLKALRATSPDGVSTVVVADAPTDAQVAALAGLAGGPDLEIVWTSAPLGQAAATNIGIRRAAASVVVLVGPTVETSGDVITPLVEALADPSVAIAGGWGVDSADGRTFTDAQPGDVFAITGDALAFRRDDFLERGPLDERFRQDRYLDLWWSLVLRDDEEETTPRRAVVVDGLPATRHDDPASAAVPAPDRDRQIKRNFYRVIDRFGGRLDLIPPR